ncbi:hypothetical protein UCRPC4_g01749 [Phaeomoniella chlamydospora]|uniref:CNNM transmembrane domain-containing protein n=1 Tax=Phaeomoniella chlamydospora TaxID=158046 RepID=A0A0G2HAA3_PHACM|nr:hypothetical protein UCRPC4_g01749 [Phaeomoniella chlamydospora]
MGQDDTFLRVLASSGEGQEKRQATRLLRLLNKGKHWVLVTILLGNVIVNEALPIVLDRSLGHGVVAALLSTVLIVIFGEILPQSVCVRYGLPVGSWSAPFVLMLMYFLAPVAWPTAKLLDWALGKGTRGGLYKKSGLKALVSLHKQQLNSDEITILSSVLDMKDKTVGSIMTPIKDAFTLSVDDILDDRLIDYIISQGYSRIPIYRWTPNGEKDFIAMLLTRTLIKYDPRDEKRVRDFGLRRLPETRPEASCLDIINFFQEGKAHMVLISENPGGESGAVGIVTFEDVIEELIGEEIVDESDVFIDVHNAIRRIGPSPELQVINDPAINPTGFSSKRHLGADSPAAISMIELTPSGTAAASNTPSSSSYPTIPSPLTPTTSNGGIFESIVNTSGVQKLVLQFSSSLLPSSSSSNTPNNNNNNNNNPTTPITYTPIESHTPSPSDATTTGIIFNSSNRNSSKNTHTHRKQNNSNSSQTSSDYHSTAEQEDKDENEPLLT